MIQDRLLMIADALAHGGTPTPVSLKVTKQGIGRPLYLNIQGHSLAGATGVRILTGATSAACTTEVAEHDISSAELNKGISFMIPMNANKFVSVALVGSTSGGTWTASISENQGQTHMIR